MPEFDKIVVVTKKTALEELTERFNTPQQAMFYVARAREQRIMQHAAEAPARVHKPVQEEDTSVEEYRDAHDAYHRALNILKESVPSGIRVQFIERSFLPTFTFGESDLVVTLGQDGLVVNTAKYLGPQPLLAINPDPVRIDGILLPFTVNEAAPALHSAVEGRFNTHRISMAMAELDNGQVIHGLNDLYIGRQSHVSARYRLAYGDRAEDQSSSGIIVSTGAGSTGWFRSVVTGAAEIVREFAHLDEAAAAKEKYRFDWESDFLYYSVREPFVSRTSSAQMAFGRIDAGATLEVISQMPQNGVIFSDGIEEDYLAFNSGSTARIRLADRKLNLIANGRLSLHHGFREAVELELMARHGAAA